MSPLRILALVGTALLLQGCGGADHPPVPLPQAVGDAQETKSIAETPPEPHEATDWDVSYAILARDTGEAGICAKIDPLAVQGFGFNPPGRQLYSMRARCYFDVALVTGDGRHCDEVVSRSTPLLDGSAVSREACLAEVGRHKRDDVRRNGPQLRAQPVLERMGYTSDMIPAALIASETDASSSWDAFYRTLVDTPDGASRSFPI